MIDSTLQALCDMADTISRRQRAVIEPMRANLVRVVDDSAVTVIAVMVTLIGGPA